MAKTTARGRVATGILAGALAALLPAGVEARGGPPAPGKPAPKKPEPEKPVGATVSGVAKDDAGAPVAGAEAVAVHATEKGVWKAKTDAKGAFAIRGVPAGEVTVVVRARSRVPFEKKVTVPATGTVGCDATLPLGVRFAGKVTDMRGAAIGGAVVEAVPSEDGGRFSFSSADPVRSKADGTFVSDGLRAGGRYTLRVSHPHHADVELPDMPAEAGAGHEGLDVVMEDAAWVRGVVVDASGKPIASARVSVGDEDDGSGAPEWIRSFLAGRGIIVSFSSSGGDEGDPVDAQGRFEVGGLVETEVQISAIADGYFRTKWTVEGLEAGKGKDGVRIALEAATAWVEGRVVDAAGKGLAGVTVTANGDLGVAGESKTDAVGAFRLSRLRSRKPVTLVAEAEGRATAKRADVALDSGGVTLTLHLSPRIRGRIVDPSGKVAPKVLLSIRSKVDERTEFHSTFVDQTEKGFDVAVPIGEITVNASTPDGLAGQVGEWTTEPAKVVDAGTVTLERRAPRPPGGDDEDDDEDDEE
jgi:protocatechuate 3,4-dioxygenase beta subunit